ncbi:MAG: hypothetical protein O2856_18245, partial [Planctomycetota bacterium]|nr:hypothetical protein [Planctomycetota bacterium]
RRCMAIMKRDRKYLAQWPYFFGLSASAQTSDEMADRFLNGQRRSIKMPLDKAGINGVFGSIVRTRSLERFWRTQNSQIFGKSQFVGTGMLWSVCIAPTHLECI